VPWKLLEQKIEDWCLLEFGIDRESGFQRICLPEMPHRASRDTGEHEEYEDGQHADHEADRSAHFHPSLLEIPANEASLA
jgi:hypothetical protein